MENCRQRYESIRNELPSWTSDELTALSVLTWKAIIVWCVPEGKATGKKESLMQQWVDAGRPVASIEADENASSPAA